MTTELTIVPQSNEIVVNTTAMQTIVAPVALEVAIAPVGIQGKPGLSGIPDATQTFTGQTIVTVSHNRGYRPIVSVTDFNGDAISGSVQHLSLNTFSVSFNVPQSGRITYL